MGFLQALEQIAARATVAEFVGDQRGSGVSVSEAQQASLAQQQQELKEREAEAG